MVKHYWGAIILFTSFFPGPVYAGFELICKGGFAQPKHESVYVDCGDRLKVINALRLSWLSLRKVGIGGVSENLCWDALETARSIHPSVSMEGIAENFFMMCNEGLAYVEN